MNNFVFNKEYLTCIKSLVSHHFDFLDLYILLSNKKYDPSYGPSYYTPVLKFKYAHHIYG